MCGKIIFLWKVISSTINHQPKPLWSIHTCSECKSKFKFLYFIFSVGETVKDLKLHLPTVVKLSKFFTQHNTSSLKARGHFLLWDIHASYFWIIFVFVWNKLNFHSLEQRPLKIKVILNSKLVVGTSNYLCSFNRLVHNILCCNFSLQENIFSR